MAKLSLRERAQQLTNSLPFMIDRVKGDTKDLIDNPCTIIDFGYMKGDDGDYVCFTVKENKESFYFGNSILTEALQELEDDGYRSEIEKNGLSIKLVEREAKKSGRNYVAVEFL